MAEAALLDVAMPHRDQDRFRATHISPELRESIVNGLKQGIGVIKLAQTLSCSPHTVQAVREQTPGLPDWKQNLSGKLKQFVHLVADDLVENYKQLTHDSKPIAMAVAIDKILLLDGEPSQIIETRHKVDISLLQSSLKSLPEPCLDVETVCTTSALGNS